MNTTTKREYNWIVWQLRCPQCHWLYFRRNKNAPKDETYRAAVQNCPQCSTETCPDDCEPV